MSTIPLVAGVLRPFQLAGGPQEITADDRAAEHVIRRRPQPAGAES